jgi:hypothetical protein
LKKNCFRIRKKWNNHSNSFKRWRCWIIC